MITSAANREVRALRRLRTRDNRDRLGVVLVEGRFAIAEALDAGGVLDRLVTTPRAEAAHRDLVRAAASAGARTIAVSEAIMGSLCETASPPSLLAIVKRPSVAASVSDRWCRLGIAGVHDPGVLGSMLRTAAAFGVDAVFVAAGSADPWAPKVVRASAAAGWRIRVEHPADLDAVIDEARGLEADVVVLDEVLPGRLEPGSRLLLVTGDDFVRLDPAMRLEGTRSRPGLPVSSVLPVVLSDWTRSGRG